MCFFFLVFHLYMIQLHYDIPKSIEAMSEFIFISRFDCHMLSCLFHLSVETSPLILRYNNIYKAILSIITYLPF